MEIVVLLASIGVYSLSNGKQTDDSGQQDDEPLPLVRRARRPRKEHGRDGSEEGKGVDHEAEEGHRSQDGQVVSQTYGSQLAVGRQFGVD